MWTRRAAIALTAGAACGGIANAALPEPRSVAIDFRDIPRSVHERLMRRAMAKATGNPRFPFGAAIARAGEVQVMAEGVNNGARNPTLHGEIAAINDYVRQHGKRDWRAMILYTTAEPCPMCMSALVWAGIGGVVFGTSIAGLSRAGFNQIDITAASVIQSAPFYHGALLGGVLAAETDRMFADRPRG